MSHVEWVKLKVRRKPGLIRVRGVLMGVSAEAVCSCGDPGCVPGLQEAVIEGLLYRLAGHAFPASLAVGVKCHGRVIYEPVALFPDAGAIPPDEVSPGFVKAVH